MSVREDKGVSVREGKSVSAVRKNKGVSREGRGVCKAGVCR